MLDTSLYHAVVDDVVVVEPPPRVASIVVPGLAATVIADWSSISRIPVGLTPWFLLLPWLLIALRRVYTLPQTDRLTNGLRWVHLYTRIIYANLSHTLRASMLLGWLVSLVRVRPTSKRERCDVMDRATLGKARCDQLFQ